MSKKNKGRSAATSGSSDASETSSPKRSGAPRAPRGPLAERLAFKADKVHSLASEIAKVMESRGAPKDNCDAAKAFLGQVEEWREKIFALKSSGWEPSSKSVKVAIVEGDPIQIMSEHLARYGFIDGLVEGRVQLVAGSVVEVSRFQIDVMLKDAETGKFYGYAPRKFLERR